MSKLLTRALDQAFEELYENAVQTSRECFPESLPQDLAQLADHGFLLVLAEQLLHIAGVIDTCANIFLKDGGTMIIRNLALEKVPTTRELLARLEAAEQKRRHAFASLSDEQLQRTIRDSEGELSSIAALLLEALARGMVFRGKIEAYVELTRAKN